MSSAVAEAFRTALEALVSERQFVLHGELRQRTPERMAKALLEMTAGYAEDPKQILATCFKSPADEIVALEGIEFVSLCEHHLLPFRGVAAVAYIPNGRVVGLSKLARLVECFARRLQLQERLTHEIAHAIQGNLDAKGTAVIVRSSHSCMELRGVKKVGAKMVTSCMLGAFRDKPEARAEVMALLKG